MTPPIPAPADLPEGTRSYAVREVFPTLQGEGANAGMASVFIRFAGCNLWNGRDADRARDADRTGARCPLWCDTDFVGGAHMTAAELVDVVREYGGDEFPLFVFTGGEPLLHLTEGLLARMRAEFPRARFAVETNGTVAPRRGVRDLLDWVCVSPKLPPHELVVREGDELKVVWPEYNPSTYEELADSFTHAFVSPQARPTPRVGVTTLSPDYTGQAIAFCLDHPRLRLSVQTHKVVDIP